MGSYVVVLQGSGGSGAAAARGEMLPIVEAYLTTVLLPAAGTGMSLRNSRELRTLSVAMDHIITGEVAQAADVLVQRFKAVEAAHADGNWGASKHLELIADGTISAITDQEKKHAARREKEEVKLRATIATLGRRSQG